MKAVIFDLDGTLVDSAPAIQAIAGRFLSTIGQEPLTFEEARSFIGNGVKVFLQRALRARAVEVDEAGFEAHLTRFKAFYDAAPGAENTPYPGVDATLAALSGAGLRLGICTNKPMAPTRAVLAAHRWDGLFGSVVAGDSLSVTKPDPGPLSEAARLLGVGLADVLYVGDSEVDAETARNAGVPFALWLHGYRKSAPEALGAALAFGDYAALAEFAGVLPA